MKLGAEFFSRDVLEVAPELLGKTIARKLNDGTVRRFIITETEAYRGEEDKACHASRGRTPRTEVMYWQGGYIYVYLIYGIHYMLNFVASDKGNPQAVLIRGISEISGPGRVTKALQIDMQINKKNIGETPEIWIEDTGNKAAFITSTRIGIDYAGDLWKNKPWRFILNNE